MKHEKISSDLQYSSEDKNLDNDFNRKKKKFLRHELWRKIFIGIFAVILALYAVVGVVGIN